jgi:drug/metabolite transporter (DMT)-like permease
LTTIRFLLATIVFIPDLIKNSFNFNAFLGGVEIGIWCSIGFITQAMSLQFTSASKASFFSGLGVVFVPLLDYIFKREKRERERDQPETSSHKKSPFHSALIAFLGVAILECGGIEPPHVKDLFLLLTPMAFATSFWRAEKVSRKYPQYTTLTVFGTMLTVSVTSIIWAIFDRSFPLSFSSLKLLFEKIITPPLVAMGLLYIGLICTGWASFSEQSAMQHITAAETTLIYTLEPLAATLFSSLILHESIGLNTGSFAVKI